MLKNLILFLILWMPAGVVMASEDDPYLWLEEIESDAALAWGAEQNEKAIKQLERKENTN